MQEVLKQKPILEKRTSGMIDCSSLLLHWFNMSAYHFIRLANCKLFDIGGGAIRAADTDRITILATMYDWVAAGR
jgi:hypothetical protein